MYQIAWAMALTEATEGDDWLNDQSVCRDSLVKTNYNIHHERTSSRLRTIEIYCPPPRFDNTYLFLDARLSSIISSTGITGAFISSMNIKNTLIFDERTMND